MASSYEVALGYLGAITRDSSYEYVFCLCSKYSDNSLISRIWTGLISHSNSFLALFPVSGCSSSVDILAPQLRLWSLKLGWFLHHPQLQLLDPCVWSSGWPMESVIPRVVWKVSLKETLCAVSLIFQWLCHQPILLFEQRRSPTTPSTLMPTIPSQKCSGILCTLRSECWRGLIPTLSWLLEDAGQLLTPTLTVFLSGTCWLMGKINCWSDLAIAMFDTFFGAILSRFFSTFFPLVLAVPTGMTVTWPNWPL